MLLERKTAVIYGAGGAVGGTIARAFASEGASVFLAGRTRTTLEKVAAHISRAGGKVEIAELDPLDERSVELYAAAVVANAGGLDISFNAIGLGDTQGVPLVEISHEHFALPIINAMKTHFCTTTTAARHMAKKRSG